MSAPYLRTAVRFAVWRIAPVALLAYALVASAPGQASQRVDYKQKIEPLFKARCSPCHFGADPSGDLSLESFDTLKKGGVSGAMFVPGRPDESELLNRILGRGGMPRMPMGFKPLSDEDTKLIRDWIAQGAVNSTGPVARHWAYVAPIKPALPPVRDQDWPLNPIDFFVLSRLEKEKLRPSESADRVTLLRRVTLDLTGLPPTPSEVDAFLADTAPDAYEKAVDRLLASPHYGERMALPWLDAARYADSNGFQQDGDTHQYLWRDWVVNAFNADMPYDQFTIEQLAGDLLPNPTLHQQIATAFNRNHMLNGEGGAIPEEQRNVVLFDRVDTTATTFLGLTMACARCHDHKYDPITQRDYYSLMAYFNNVPETGVPAGGGQYRFADPVVTAGGEDEMKRLTELRDQVKTAEAARHEFILSDKFTPAFETWKQQAIAGIDLAKRFPIKMSAWYELGTEVGDVNELFNSDKFPLTEIPEGSRERPDLADGQVHPLTGENTAFYFARVIEASARVPLLISIGSDDGVKLQADGKTYLASLGQRAALPDTHLVELPTQPGRFVLVLKVVNRGGIGGFYFKAYPGGVKDEVAAHLDSIDPQSEVVLRQYFAARHRLVVPFDNAVIAAREELVAFEKDLPRVMVMSDAMPRKTYIYNRGSYTEPLDEVQPAAPEVLSRDAGSNRLSLARWMVDASNPLTARVQVNRIWQIFYGRGLVKTPENFGLQGEAPSHPELLDWLAVDFRENGWKMKRLIRMIVTSRTYRQTSKVSGDLLQKDPENRFLARGPRFRMPSMILRDVALASSGLLDPKLGGKPVYPYQPKGIWDGLAITLERDFTYPQSKGRENHRRSLYTFWRRTVAPGNMFDSSSRQVCTVRPSLTSTPLHALTMLNDVTWVEAGRALAQQVMSESAPEERLTEAFRRVCARRPSPSELKVLLRALDRSLAEFRANPDQAKMYLALGDHPVDAERDPVELAAYASVCLAIFNLDEAMTKE